MHSISIWVPIVFTYILCLSKRTLKKKKGHPGIVILAECFLDFFFLRVGLGVMGWDSGQKCPLFFFSSFSYIISSIPIYNQIYKKLARQISFGFRILVKLGSYNFQNQTATPTFSKNCSQLHRGSRVFLKRNFMVNFCLFQILEFLYKI